MSSLSLVWERHTPGGACDACYPDLTRFDSFASPLLPRLQIGNLTYASNGWDLPAQFIGKFSDRTCAVAGLVAALAALYKNADTANPAVKKQ